MSESDEDDVAMVVDNGSGSIKAGFAGEDEPRFMFPSFLGRPKYQRIVPPFIHNGREYIGDEAQSLRGICSLRYPIEHGIVTNWDNMEKIWEHIFDHNHLRMRPEECPVLFTDIPKSTRASREKTTQIMFETFKAKGFHICSQGVLAHFSMGRSMAIILDVGAGVMSVVPVVNGYIINPAIEKINFGGRDLTNLLMKMLNERGYSFATTAEREVVREIKEELCYVAHDFDNEMLGPSRLKKTYTLPDFHDVTLGNERFRVSEVLFNPSIAGFGHRSVQQLVYDSLMKCDLDLRRDLYCNVFVCGGSTMLPYFPERLKKELSALCPQLAQVRVSAPIERKYSAWIGGSILASLSSFANEWITREEYQEHGPRIVHQKCVN